MALAVVMIVLLANSYGGRTLNLLHRVCLGDTLVVCTTARVECGQQWSGSSG